MSILIDRSTRLVVQGMTGREGTFHTEQMQAFGTNVVAGVSPGKGGTTHLGRSAAGRGPDFGILTKVADEDDFIDALACHECCSFRPFVWALNRGAGKMKTEFEGLERHYTRILAGRCDG